MTNQNIVKDLEIVRWAHGGDGIAIGQEEPYKGMVFFVPGAVPGDVVTIRIQRRKKRWARGELLELKTPSAERVEPPCEFQSRCGGCPWMVGSDEAQTASRLAILQAESQKHLGWSDALIEQRVSLASPSKERLAYRHRVRLAWQRVAGGKLLLGYRAGSSHKVVDIDHCAVAVPAISESLDGLRQRLLTLDSRSGEVLLLAGAEGVAGQIRPERGPELPFGLEEVHVRQGSVDILGRPETFFQANPDVTGNLMQEVESIARDARSGAESEAVEFFAGVGTMTVPLLKAGYRVHAYESAPQSREAFLRNTKPHGEASWHRTDLLELGIPLPAPPRPNLVLLDPPRQGALPLMPWIGVCGAHTVVMVSCDVATVMRDLAAIAGRPESPYDVERIVGYDMFPHTGHQEILAVARRREPSD